MGKGRITALLLAVVVIGLALMRTATASHTTTHKAFSGGAEFKGLVVKTESNPTGTEITTVDPNWQTVDSRGFQIPAGESQLIVVDFVAETNCVGDFGACLTRVLAGRTLPTAQEMEPAMGVFQIDTAGDAGDFSEGHAMSRALCVRNATGSPLNVSVWLQATRTASGTPSIFGLADWTFKIARNAPCSPFVDI